MSAARILVVDDHDIARQGVCALIAVERDWLVCGEARTGREALRLSAELKPDIVIIDVLMPDLNGLDAARQIKKLVPSVEVLVLSGHEESELIRSVFDAGVRAYVFKSRARTDLRPAIAALLAGNPYFTPEVAEMLRRRPPEGERQGRGDIELTAREREIVQLLTEGRSNKEVAATLSISTKTVETHRASIMRKLGLENFGDLVRYAIRHKITEA